MTTIQNIAVLLTCHNRKDKTLQCLEALFLQQGLNKSFNLEVFMVDDGSTDDTAGTVNNRYPEINIIHGNGNLYWNRGMHLAWETAVNDHTKFDFYLWLNNDTNLLSDAINELLQCAMWVSKPPIICGAVCSEKTLTYTYGGKTKEGFEILPKDKIQNCNSINGNCVLIPKAVYEQIGNLDPIFPHAIGDYDYGLRAIKKGIPVITTRKYIAYCQKNNNLPQWCYKNVPLKERIKALYSPLGNSHPNYFFLFERRHYGIAVAIKHYFTIHLRALIPSLWK